MTQSETKKISSFLKVNLGAAALTYRPARARAACAARPARGLVRASRVVDRVLVLRPGVRPVPLRWENRVQDIGPP